MTTTPGQRERAKRAATEALAREMTLAMLGRRGETQDEQYRAMADAAIDAYESALAEQPRGEPDVEGAEARVALTRITGVLARADLAGGEGWLPRVAEEVLAAAQQPRGDEERLREGDLVEWYAGGWSGKVVQVHPALYIVEWDNADKPARKETVRREFLRPLAPPTDGEERTDG